MPKQHEVEVTEAQWKVARAVLADGAPDVLVADRLGVSVETVKSHLRKVFKATGVATRTELAVKVWSGQLDLISPHRLSLLSALEDFIGSERVA